MFSFACRVSEEVLFPQFAVGYAKKAKSVVSKYDRGLLDTTTAKLDEFTSNYVDTAEELKDQAQEKFTAVVSKRDEYVDSAYSFADSHIEPVAGEHKRDSAVGKMLFLPFLVLLRLKTHLTSLLTSKYESSKTKVTEMVVPHYNRASGTCFSVFKFVKVQVVAAVETPVIQQTLTTLSSTVATLKSDYVIPFSSTLTDKIDCVVKSENFKEAKTALLDSKVALMNSSAYVRCEECATTVSKMWPVSFAIEKSQELYKNGLKYASKLASMSSA